MQMATAKQEKIVATCNNHPKLSTRQVAKICDTDHAYVVQVMQRYNIARQETKDFQNNKVEILQGIQHRILKSITDEDIQKAPMGSRVLAVAQLIDKERLIEGLSTSNTAVIHADIEQLRHDKHTQDSTTIDIDAE